MGLKWRGFISICSLVVSFIFVVPAGGAPHCSWLLSDHATHLLQDEIWRAATLYAETSLRPLRAISVLRGDEAGILPPLGDQNSHVISLGSGPDIFRPIYAFPAAGHFHLLDSLQGWGRPPSPQVVIDETEARLRALAPGVRVERVQPGFLGVFQPSDLETNESLVERFVSLTQYPAPLVWRVRWVSEGAGPQTKYFYLHMMNYHDEEWVQHFWNAQIPQQAGVVGLLITGAPAPTGDLFQEFMNRLSAPGALVFETFHFRDTDQPLDGEDEGRFDWLRAQGYQVLFRERELSRFFLNSMTSQVFLKAK